MTARRQRTHPLDEAIARLSGLAARGVTPARMAREVASILTGWKGEACGEEPQDLAERLGLLQEQLRAGMEAAAEQLADVDRSDASAVRHAGLVHAALAAALGAVVEAMDGSGGEAAPAVEASPDGREDPPMSGLATEGGAGDAVTIPPLAGWNLLAVDGGHPEQLRSGGGASGAKATRAQATMPKATKRRSRGRNGKATTTPLLIT
jgi:hypothetical protein